MYKNIVITCVVKVLVKKNWKKVNNRLNFTVVIGLAYFVETYCNKKHSRNP